MPLFNTHWAKRLTMPVDPNEPKARELELFRRKCNISHEEFSLFVMTSAGYFRMQIEAMAAGFREEFRIASDKQIIAAVAVLCVGMDLKESAGVVDMQGVLSSRKRVSPAIEQIMKNADELLDRLSRSKIQSIGVAVANIS